MAVRLYLEQLATSAAQMATSVNVPDSDPDSPLRWWAKAFTDQCWEALEELRFFHTLDILPGLVGHD